MNTNDRIGAWLQENRIEKGYSQQQVADMLGVSRIAFHIGKTEKEQYMLLT